MLDDSFCCLRSLWFGGEYMHTDVHAGYACGCSLSVTCQVAVVNTIMC